MQVDGFMLNRIRQMTPHELQDFIQKIRNQCYSDGYEVGYEKGLREGESEFDESDADQQMEFLRHSDYITAAVTDDDLLSTMADYGVPDLEAKMILDQRSRISKGGQDGTPMS